ncbi:MAG: flagellar biosynthesis anti-sigma factor FlgM [Deltaproteobacteria bacterium]|nr:flagellar biosynthesis anti-sigma factor FlgM [Deltaproteobacteria bacterium]
MKVTGSGAGPADRAGDIGGAGKAGGVGAGSEKRRPGKSEEAGSDSSEKVAISSRARDIAKAKEAVGSGGDVDEAKVAKFRAAIQNGSYKVDADKVADKMVDEHLHTLF